MVSVVIEGERERKRDREMRERGREKRERDISGLCGGQVGGFLKH